MVLLKRDDDTEADPGVRPVWPSETAVSETYPEPGGAPDTRDGAEMFALRCSQCGWPIVDARQHKSCPLCENTNFRGGPS